MKKTNFKVIASYGESLERYALFRIIFFGVGLIALVIALFVTPQIETLDINNMSDGEFFSAIAGSLLIWLILMLVLIFGVCIIGFVVLGLYGKYVIQLRNCMKITQSLFLRNVFICEALRPVLWVLQLFLIGSLNNVPLYLINCISMGVSLYEILQLRKWVGFFPDYEMKPSEFSSLRANLNIWMFSGIVFIAVSLIQVIGLSEGLFLIIIEGGSLLTISVAVWYFGKKIAWLFS